jgi:hypothetical protein
MKLSIIALLAFAPIAFSQFLAHSLSTPETEAGGAAAITLTFTASPSANVAALEWAFSLPKGVTAGEPVLSPAAIAAGKTVICKGEKCLFGGFAAADINAKPVPSGVIATVPLEISPTAAPGVVFFAISKVLGADSYGTAITVAAPKPVALKIKRRRL